MRIPGALTMDEGSISHQNGGQMGPQPGSMINNKQSEEVNQRTQYSIPGILHFIQHEWARFELERSQWEVDRAELQARIAFLQGERKGQENLKNDLVRRIKMLEYALKQERAKFHKLKYGVDLNQGEVKPPVLEEGVEAPGMDTDTPYTSVSNATWRQGRQLLRQYLQEIGYTDRIIDVRSNRVRQMLGLNNNNLANTTSSVDQSQVDPQQAPFTSTNGTQIESNKRSLEGGRRTPAKKTQPSTFAEAMMLDTEASVMANLDFLSNPDVDMDEEGDMDDDGDLLEDDQNLQDDMDDVRQTMKSSRKSKGLMLGEGLTDDVDAEAMEVLNELNLLSESADTDSDLQRQSDADWNQQMVFQGQTANRRPLVAGLGAGAGGEDETLDGSLGLGELAQLTVNNDAETTYDMASNKEAFRKTWSAKYTLRSHFDGVRALAFHPTEPVLITASEDHTLKLWNLQKTVPAKKSASLDVEPLYTFRCHTGPVLCLSISSTGEHCYSGGLDGVINCWNVPSSHIDPYDLFEPDVLLASLTGHTDAVWGLAHHQASQSLLSCSADGTVKLWQPHASGSGVSKQQNCVKQTFLSEAYAADGVVATSVDFVRDETNKVAAAYSNASCVIWDCETGKSIITLQEATTGTKGDSVVKPSLGKEGANIRENPVARHINKIVCHPTLPLTITAHDDRHIRFWDNNTGKMVHSMVAHLDSVTCLAVDPNGLYLLSGSHDCSIRLWNIENKTCVQEITAHRKKFDESILDVAFHPSRGYIASAGADALAKLWIDQKI